jgi:hypothetical protein
LGKAVDKHIPVLFQKLNTFETEDTRFIKVKIWLMHLEENLNGSYFEKSVVEDAIGSLANTPILAYIEDNSEGEEDFSDHRMVLVKEDGKFKIKYIGKAIGLIPETNNAQFEKRVCDDGIEREFLTCDGLIWTKWDDPIDIFNRDVIKSQSMELHSDSYEGEFKEDGLFHFSKFQFFGACALGDDVLPAMRNASIEAQFSLQEIKEDVQQKMEQFKSLFSNDDEGGKQNVDEKLELLEKYSITQEDLESKSINLEDYSLEELESKLQEFTTDETQDSQDDELDKENFALVASQLRDELRAELYKDYTEDEWGYKSRSYWYVDHTDNLIIAEDTKDNYRLVALSYSVSNDTVSIEFDSKKRVKLAYEVIEDESELQFNVSSKDKVQYELSVKEKELEKSFTAEKEEVQTELETVKGDFTKLEEEVSELRNFKSSKLTEERSLAEQELFERFESELTEDEIKVIKEVSSEFSLEQIEEKLYTLVGKKKTAFSKQTKKEKQSVKVGLDFSKEENEKPNPYGDLFDKFATKE